MSARGYHLRQRRWRPGAIVEHDVVEIFGGGKRVTSVSRVVYAIVTGNNYMRDCRRKNRRSEKNSQNTRAFFRWLFAVPCRAVPCDGYPTDSDTADNGGGPECTAE